MGANPGGATLTGGGSQPFVNGVATFSVSLDKTGTGYTLLASSSGFSNVTSNAFNVTGVPLITVGNVVPDRVLAPTSGFIMGDTGRTFTVDVTVVDPGSNASAAGTMVIGMTSTGATPLTFQTAGSSATCVTNCTGAVTWSATSTAGGITFTHSSGTPLAGSVYRFTVSLASIPALTADATDSFTANYTRTQTSGSVAAANTLKRYSLEITDISPPGASASAGATINPVMTVFNRSSATISSPFLTAGSTTLGGTAFASTPGSTISASTVAANASGTATFTGAVVTGSTGSQTVVGNAAKNATNTAPTFTKSTTVTVASFPLSVTKTGAGSGTATSSPVGINCGATCSANFNNGTSVTLTATPDAGSTFNGWSGDGTGTTTRTVTVDAAKAVTALFKANQTINFAALGAKTFGDAPFTVSATGGASGNPVTFTATGNCTSGGTNGATITITGAGSCTVTADQAGTGNYNAASSVPQSFTISKAQADCSSITGYTVTFDGNPHTATGACKDLSGTALAGLDLTGTTHTNAGTFNADPWTFTPTNPNYAAKNGTVNDKINQAQADCSSITGYTVIYDGNAHTATGACKDLSGTALAGLDLTGTTHTNAGTFNADPWTFTPTNPNYAAKNGTVNDKITAEPITITPTSGQSKVYGTAADPGLTFDPTPALLGTDTFSGALARAAGSDAGNYAINLGTLSAGANYSLSLSTTTVNFAITKRPVEVTANAGQTKVYGTNDPTFGYHISSGSLVGGDAFTGALDRVGGETVGSYAIHQGTLDLGGNYNLTFVSNNFSITQRDLTVASHGVNKEYDGNAVATVSLTDNALSGDVVTDAYTSASFPDKDVGTGLTVSVHGISISGADAGNYHLTNTSDTTTANITQRDLTVQAHGVNKQYDSTTAATVTLSDNALSGDVVTDAYTSASFPDKDVGDREDGLGVGISISGTDAGNYHLTNTSDTTTANITQRDLTVQAHGVNKQYDSTTAATVTLSDNALSGDVVTDAYTSASFPDKDVGTGLTVSVHGISISGADAGNYHLTNTSDTTTANITQRDLTVQAHGVNKQYDSTTAATVTLSDNALSGDVVTDAYTSASFPDKDVGTALTVWV